MLADFFENPLATRQVAEISKTTDVVMIPVTNVEVPKKAYPSKTRWWIWTKRRPQALTFISTILSSLQEKD